MVTVRPGDVLIVCVDRQINVAQIEHIRDALLARLPDLVDVVVVNATQVAVYRPEAPSGD